MQKSTSFQFVRWLAAGLVCAGIGLALLKVTAGLLGWPYALATLFTAEICTVLNFLLVDRWAFGHARPTWKRLGQYHVANAAGFVAWWIAANALQRAGVHYLLASLLGTLLSSGLSIVTNFFWIWRKPVAAKGAVGRQSGSN